MMLMTTLMTMLMTMLKRQRSAAQRSAFALGRCIAEVVWVLSQGSLLRLTFHMKSQQSKTLHSKTPDTLQSCSKHRAWQ